MQASSSSVGIPWSLSMPSGINCITNDEHIQFQNPPRRWATQGGISTPILQLVQSSKAQTPGLWDPWLGRDRPSPCTRSSRDQGETWAAGAPTGVPAEVSWTFTFLLSSWSSSTWIWEEKEEGRDRGQLTSSVAPDVYLILAFIIRGSQEVPDIPAIEPRLAMRHHPARSTQHSSSSWQSRHFHLPILSPRAGTTTLWLCISGPKFP